MKLKITFYLIVLCLSSCKIMKYTSQQEFIEMSNEMPITMKNNLMIISAKVDTLNYDLVFDTGAGGAVITQNNFVIGKDEKDAISFGKIVLPNGEKLKNLFFPINLCTSMFCFNSYLIRYIPSQKGLCNENENTIDGILGVDFLKELERKQIYIDFENQVILNPKKALTDSLKENMVLAKTEFFKKKHFKIYIKIDNKEIPFLFDTGNSAFDLVVTKAFESTQKPDKTYQGAMTSFIDSSMPSAIYNFYNNSSYTMAGIQDSIGLVKISDFKDNNAGIGFIKRYNWLIDYEKETVHFSPIENTRKNSSTEWNDYYVNNSENKLIIFLKNADATKYDVGDRVLRVNNVDITEGNICEWVKTLNDNEFDWNTANIMILSN